LATYDNAVRAALSFLKDHPDKRSTLKPELTELVSRTKEMKARTGK
jgi:NAD+--asparagine ADP-ribosyltransferase